MFFIASIVEIFVIFKHPHMLEKQRSKMKRDQTAFPLTCILCQSAGTLRAYLYPCVMSSNLQARLVTR